MTNASKTFHSFPILSFFENTRSANVPLVYLKDSSIASSFLFLFIHNMALLERLVIITTDVGVQNQKKSKKSCCSRSQKTQVLISTLALFELFDVFPCSFSPDNGVSLGSISVYLHTSDIILAVGSCHYIVYI